VCTPMGNGKVVMTQTLNNCLSYTICLDNHRGIYEFSDYQIWDANVGGKNDT
jgi:hypothetical protein